MTHEASRMSEMDDYFVKKLFPIEVLFIINGSYVAEPKCDASQTMVDAWQELSSHHQINRFIGIHLSS